MSLQTDITDLLSRYRDASKSVPFNDAGVEHSAVPADGMIGGFSFAPDGQTLDYGPAARQMGIVPIRQVDIAELAKARGMTQNAILDKLYGAGQWQSQSGSDPNSGNPMLFVKPTDPNKATEAYSGMIAQSDLPFWSVPHPAPGLVQGIMNGDSGGFGMLVKALATAGIGSATGLTDIIGNALGGAPGIDIGDGLLPSGYNLPTGGLGNLAGGAGSSALGGGIGGDTLGGLADPFTAPEIPEVYQTAPNISGGSNTLGDFLQNVPPVPPVNPFGNNSQTNGLGGQPTTAQGGTDEFGNAIDNTGGTSATATDIANQTASSAGGSTVANAAQQAAWQKVLNGTAGPEDWVKLGSQVLPGLIGAYQSSQQTGALTDIANQARADRAPYLQASQGYLSNPDSFYKGPQATGSLDAILRKLSVGGGVSDPAKLGIANSSLNGQYWNTVGSLGQLGLSGNVPALQTQAVTQSGQTGANLGSAVSNVFNPQQSLADLLKQFGGGVKLNNGSVPE